MNPRILSRCAGDILAENIHAPLAAGVRAEAVLLTLVLVLVLVLGLGLGVVTGVGALRLVLVLAFLLGRCRGRG